VRQVSINADSNPGFDDCPTIAPNTRVRLRGKPIALTLRTPDGVVVGPDRWAGFVIVRLDEPAIYHHADGRLEDLPEIREFVENLDILSA
jgi:hypothetical protein